MRRILLPFRLLLDALLSPAFGPTQVNLVFIANKASHKFEEIANDSHVNISFYDQQTTNWASYCGIARISQDKELIAKHWNPMCVAPPCL